MVTGPMFSPRRCDCNFDGQRSAAGRVSTSLTPIRGLRQHGHERGLNFLVLGMLARDDLRHHPGKMTRHELRAALIHYLTLKLGPLDQVTDIVLADIGYTGNIQKGLRRVLDSEGLKIRLHGLYLMPHGEAFVDQAVVASLESERADCERELADVEAQIDIGCRLLALPDEVIDAERERTAPDVALTQAS